MTTGIGFGILLHQQGVGDVKHLRTDAQGLKKQTGGVQAFRKSLPYLSGDLSEGLDVTEGFPQTGFVLEGKIFRLAIHDGMVVYQRK